MHIMLDEASNPPRIKILNIAEWSPLEAHVLPGDTLEAIDRVPCNTLTFEQVPIFDSETATFASCCVLAKDCGAPGPRVFQMGHDAHAHGRHLP